MPHNIKKLVCNVRARAAGDVHQSLQELYQIIENGSSMVNEETMRLAVAELYALSEEKDDVASLHELDEYTQKLESGLGVLAVSHYGMRMENKQSAISDLQRTRKTLHKNFLDDAFVWGDAAMHGVVNFFEDLLPECPVGPAGATGATGAMGATGPMGPMGVIGGVASIGYIEVPIKSLFKSGHDYYARYGAIKQIMGESGAFTIIRPRQMSYVLSPDLFTVGEMVVGGTSGAMGIITADNGVVLTIDLVAGTFAADEVITGSASRNIAVIAFYNEAFSDLIQTAQQGLRAAVYWNLHACITSGAQTKVSATMIADSQEDQSVASFMSAYDSHVALAVELGGIAPQVPLANVLHWNSPASDLLSLKPSKLVIQYLA